MNLRKKAFSMVELIVVITIIGFILVIELMILNTKSDQYGQSYYATYNALKKAAYNVLADMYCPGDSCPAGPTSPPRPFPDTPQGLCNRLTEFINTSENNCASLIPISDMANENFATTRPHFISSNSFRFYFGDKKDITVFDSFGNPQDLYYFVVFVDINGEKRPNRIVCEGERIMPDVVPFAITRRGEVIPMGYPVYSKLYITAKIKYPSELDPTTGNMINRSSPSMSYFDAVYGAWPDTRAGASHGRVHEHADIPFSLMLTNRDIYNGSAMRQCYDGREPVLKRDTQYIAEAQPMTDRGCVGGTYSCRVVIDASIKTRY